MSPEDFIARVGPAKRTGRDKWVARCPAHDGKSSTSLAIRALADGRILVHCFGGCQVDEVVGTLGLELGDLFPETSFSQGAKPERRPFNAHDVLRCVAFEVTVARLCSSAMRAGEALSDEDDKRLGLAMSRLMAAEEIANGD